MNDTPAPAQLDAPDLPAGYVTHAAGTGYFVQSRTTSGVWYLVHGRSCSCKAGRSGLEHCWHRTQVAAYCSAVNEEKRRPRHPTLPARFYVE